MKRLFLLLAAGLIGGCAMQPNPMNDVSQTILQRTGQRVSWNRSSAEDAQANLAVGELLSHELTPESAVQIALLNNQTLQAAFEDVGIAQADLVQAGLLRNPVFEAKIKYADAGGGTALEFNATADFLDVLLIPLRSKAAAANLLSMQHRVTGEVLSLAAETKKAFYEAQAAQQSADAWKTVLEATDASSLFAHRLHDAGNISDLDLANTLAMNEQAKLDATRADMAAMEAREKLNELMGLWGGQTQWKAAGQLAEPPSGEFAQGDLEAMALVSRPDLFAGESDVRAADIGTSVSKTQFWLEGGSLGATAERGEEGGWVTGPIIGVPIPIFDNGAATLARAQGAWRQTLRRLAALGVKVRSQVRAATARVAAARQRALFFRNTMLPLRSQIVEKSQLQYNAMHTGLDQLLMAKQEQIKAGMGYVEALCDFWVARAELEYAVGGKLPAESMLGTTQPATTTPATGPTTVGPATTPATGEMDMNDPAMKHMHHHH